MSDELAILHELAAGGAMVLVTEMARSTWESFRAAVASFFRSGPPEQVDEQRADDEMRTIEAARTRLLQAPQTQREAVTQQVQQQLMFQLGMFLREHPESQAALRSLIASVTDSSPGTVQHNNVVNNTDSQVIISGGSLNAPSITFHPQGGTR
ncbi:hypothetical protein ACPCDX_23820 [Streptomyces koyangensis]|uniref:hypothetical protein n=1 Tax=Streptomyces TaxID=1883 RepID=UPI00339F7AF4